MDMQPISSVANVTDEPPLCLANTSCCRKLSVFQEDLDIETKQLDIILRDLRHYYNTIKTKRQLGLDVPAGFCRDTIHKQQFQLHSPPRKLSRIRLESNEKSPITLFTSDHTGDN
jgi:hypothetical protein